MIQRLEAEGISYDTMKLGMISKKLTDPTYLKWTLDALLRLPGALLKYWRIQRRVQPDVVVCTSFRKAAILKPPIDEEMLVMYIHENPRDSFWTRQVIDSEKSPAAYMACSEYIRDRLIERGVAPERAVAVPNGVEKVPDERLPDGSADEEPPTIGIVGQIGEWKGHDDLLDAVRRLVEQNVSVRCVVVGTGDDEYVQSLRQRVRAYGLEEVMEFRGFVHGTDAIYADLDVCVVLSRFEEPFGLVAAEAGIRGLPVVATRRGGLPEIVEDGETGFLVEAEDPSALADRVRCLLQNAGLRKRMGKAARKRICQRFVKLRMVGQAEKTLQEVANEEAK
jgi:glycosyltransferase involved in cell wall biosynthesis